MKASLLRLSPVFEGGECAEEPFAVDVVPLEQDQKASVQSRSKEEVPTERPSVRWVQRTSAAAPLGRAPLSFPVHLPGSVTDSQLIRMQDVNFTVIRGLQRKATLAARQSRFCPVSKRRSAFVSTSGRALVYACAGLPRAAGGDTDGR
jgi:hypothetical protein